MSTTLETNGRAIVLRENMIIGISAVGLLALVVGVFRFGMAFNSFIYEQKTTTQEIAKLNREFVAFRTEIIAYVDNAVRMALVKQYTAAHDEIRTTLFRQRLLPEYKSVADAYPDFEELQKFVEKYSAAERASKVAK